MNDTLKQFLINCNTCYSNGEFYKCSASEACEIEKIFEREIFVSYPCDINDALYDTIFYLAKQKFPTDEFFNKITSVNTGYGEDIILDNPAGSMNELKEGEWDKWKILNCDYVVSEKLDGLSVVLYYVNGNLVKAASRGDGFKGKDILRHIKHISNVPQKLNENITVEIRGELICPISKIQNMISDLYNETKKEYKNGRNTIAGFLNSKNTLLSVAKYAKFNAFHISGKFDSEFEKFQKLQALNFDTPQYCLMNESQLTENFIRDYIQTVKSTSTYECDGIIVTINKPTSQYEGFETGTINPKCSRKIKIGVTNNRGETTITGITWEISKDGFFKPVLNVEPIVLCGVTITNITGHNYKYVCDNHLGVGAKIICSRSGDVIPKHVETVSYPQQLEFNLPTVKTKLNENGVDLIFDDFDNVENSEVRDNLKLMFIKKLVFFCEYLEIEESGIGTITKIFDRLLKFKNDTKITSLYVALCSLPLNVFEDEIGVNGTKFYNNLHTKLQNITEVEWCSACSVFGRGFGGKKLQKIYDTFKTLNVNGVQLASVEGFAEKNITSYLAYLPNYLKLMEETSFDLAKPAEQTITSQKFASICVAFTGCRSSEIKDAIIANGGQASDSFTKNTNVLIVKDKNSTSSKMQKAIKQGCEIITLEEAKERFL